MPYPEKARSNWWYIAPFLFGIIGGLIAYFALKDDEPIKAKTILCIPIVPFGLVGGIIAYFILRKDSPSRAKLFLYIGILFTVIAFILNILVLPEISEIEPGFQINV